MKPIEKIRTAIRLFASSFRASSKTVKAFAWTAFVLVCVVLLTALINALIVFGSARHVYNEIERLPNADVVLVLGAQTYGDALSLVLRDRVNAGIRIVEKGKAKKMLLSGDHGKTYYDEVNAMRRYVLSNAPHIPPEAIFMDHAGFRTYDSVLRAKKIFQVETMIIVTQDFHINRAVFIARDLGVDAAGLGVSEKKYRRNLKAQWYLREYFARVRAFVDLLMRREPKFLGPPIPFSGDGRESWDEGDRIASYKEDAKQRGTGD